MTGSVFTLFDRAMLVLVSAMPVAAAVFVSPLI